MNGSTQEWCSYKSFTQAEVVSFFVSRLLHRTVDLAEAQSILDTKGTKIQILPQEGEEKGNVEIKVYGIIFFNGFVKFACPIGVEDIEAFKQEWRRRNPALHVVETFIDKFEKEFCHV